MELTAEQQAVVDIDSGRHLVLAPPGTGKTQMLTERVKRALDRGVQPSEMLCGTFTIRAAAEMADRVKAETGRSEDELPLMGNLHHICYTFLFNYQVVSRTRQVVDGNFRDEALRTLRNLHPAPPFFLERHYTKMSYGEPTIDAYAYGRDFADAVNLTLALKAGTPTEFLPMRRNPCLGTDFVEDVCVDYLKLKADLFVLDFDDLLSETYKVLVDGRLPADFKPYRWLQIDEVQDLNPLQWAIVEKIAAPDAVLVFFGDYEQSIFSFMGASTRLLDKVAEGCELHFFETNFRATSYLLDLLSRYSFKTLGSSFSFLPFPARYESGEERLRILEQAEMDDVVHEAGRMLEAGETQNVAILVQTNQQADEAETCARYNGLPYVKISGFEFNSRKVFRDVAALLEVAANPLARVGWSRIVRHFARKQVGSPAAAQAFVAEMFHLGIDPRDLLQDDFVQMRALRFEMYAERAREGRIVVFDTETTGLDTLNDHIVQLTGVEYVAGKPGRQLNLFLRSPIPIPAEAEAVHHISDAKLAAVGLDPETAIRQFLAFVGTDLLIAHNLRYDRAILESSCRRYGIPFDAGLIPMCDTLDLCRRLHPELKVYKLGVLLETFGLEGNNSHDALDDVLAAGNLFLKLAEDGSQRVEAQRAWWTRHADFIAAFSGRAAEFFQQQRVRLEGRFDLRQETRAFIEYSIENRLYTFSDCRRMIREMRVGEADEDLASPTENLLDGETLPVEDLMAPLEKLFCYLERVYAKDARSFRQIVEEDWDRISKLKEVDLVDDDAQLVISTIHKAKGRQFDTVFIPYCQESYSNRAAGRKVNGFPSFQVLYGGASREENARLLYVGMSRAKRNLVLATDGTQVSPYLAPCLCCFRPGFVDFYRRVQQNGGRLYNFDETDWLARLYFLIVCKKENREPPQFIKWFDDQVASIRRIAFSLLPRCKDLKIVDQVIETALRSPDAVDRGAAIAHIRAMKDIRYVKVLRTYLLRLPSASPLKAGVISALAACARDASAREGLEDAVYDDFGPYRVDAANRLAELGVEKYKTVVKGTDEDWPVLATMMDDRARKILTWRVDHALPGADVYRQVLRC